MYMNPFRLLCLLVDASRHQKFGTEITGVQSCCFFGLPCYSLTSSHFLHVNVTRRPLYSCQHSLQRSTNVQTMYRILEILRHIFVLTNMSLPPPIIVNEVQSSLLCLHTEIHNQIYGYVLTADSGVLDYSSGSADRSMNKLKDVCHQLRADTAWFELKMNKTVLFRGTLNDHGNNSAIARPTVERITAAEHFLAFLTCCPNEKHCWLEVIHLSNDLAPGSYLDWYGDGVPSARTAWSNSHQYVSKICR